MWGTDPNFKWNDGPCDYKKAFVCKAPATADGDVNCPDCGDATDPPGDERCHNKEGWAYDSGSGMCYLIVDTELSWNDARVECEFLAGHDRGGDLVSINSFDEQRHIMSKDTRT